METHGRRVVYANYTEEQLLSGTQEERDNKVLDILTNSISIHEQNKYETKYLIDYLYGIQDIKDKEKFSRPEINNKSVENWVWADEEFLKAFLLGKPIQYAPLNDVANEEITYLNNYVKYEGKHKLDKDIYEDMFTSGRGFRYSWGSKVNDEDEAPFDLLNLDILNTEIAYSSSIKHEQLLSYIETSMKYIVQEINPNTGELEYQPRYYSEYTVYTRDMMYVIDNKQGNFRITKREALILNEHIIIEYFTNKERMSYLELVKDIQNDLNTLQNTDLDDLVQNVNNIMVFKNAEITKEGLEAIKETGAVSIKSTDQKQASIEILQSRIKSLDTQLFFVRKLNALHSILGVPEPTQNGDISNAETGKAMMIGSGFSSASIRIENQVNDFEDFDRKSLKTILKICRNSKDSKIKNLRVSDIDIKFSRNLSDNLLTKTQALNNLMTANIPPQVANAVVNLFSDPVSVTKLQEEYIKEKQDLQQQINNMQNNDSYNQNNKNNEQNNKIQDTQQLENQGQ